MAILTHILRPLSAVAMESNSYSGTGLEEYIFIYFFGGGGQPSRILEIYAPRDEFELAIFVHPENDRTRLP